MNDRTPSLQENSLAPTKLKVAYLLSILIALLSLVASLAGSQFE
jgi:hypothetical protein